MSKSICFRIEGFTLENGYFRPVFNTINDFSIKYRDDNGSLTIYITYVKIARTYVMRGEVSDFIVGQFETIREVVEWIDTNIRLIFRHSNYVGVINCYAENYFSFMHNGVEHIAALAGACDDCMDNHLLISLKMRFEDEVNYHYVVGPHDVKFEHVEKRDGYDVYFDSDISINYLPWGGRFYVPDGVVRLLIGLDVGTVCDIIVEAGCYRKNMFKHTHTVEECQCSDCFSEEMVERVEEVLARMT
jgi:hypothetical protein